MNYIVTSLSTLSVYTVANNISIYGDKVKFLPMVVKNDLIRLLSKRGSLTNCIIASCVNSTVKELDFSECEISDKSLDIVSKTCRNLTKIDINAAKGNRTDISSRGLEYLASGCKLLETVFLRRCINIDDVGIASLVMHCKYVQKLNIGGCSLITDKALKAVSNLAYLKCINFSATDVSDNGVNFLCVGSSSLSLHEVYMNKCKNLSDTSVRSLALSCLKLEVLIFHECPKMTENSRLIIGETTQNRNNLVKHLTWTVY